MHAEFFVWGGLINGWGVGFSRVGEKSLQFDEARKLGVIFK